jgi:arylsulfatase A-like enzyme
MLETIMTSASDERPDILLIMTDQMRGDCLSLENHPVLMTPNIDGIGRQGTHFMRAYTTCPSCIPSRRAMLTGRHPKNNGLVGYREGCPLAHPTFAQALVDSGYRTTLVGRHMHQYPYEEGYGFQDRTDASCYVENDAYFKALETAFPGQGGVKGHGLSNNGWTAKSWHFPDPWHPTSWIATRTRDQIRGASDDRPHFITASFYAPHPPFLPPAFYFERYLRLDLPGTAIGDWAEPPDGNSRGCRVDSNRVVLEGEALRSAQAGYFGLINHIDDQVYSILFEFTRKAAARGRPWIVIFTSDHGEMLGDHYLFRKCEPYEGSARVPFLIQGSRELGFQSGATHRGPVCLEDLAPTITELAGAEAPDDMDGGSLVPILRGETSPVRRVLHCEHNAGYDLNQAFHMLTNGRQKFIWRPYTGREELFDLDTDPLECRNLAGSSGHQNDLKIWRRRMVDQLADRPEGFSDGENLITGCDYSDLLA